MIYYARTENSAGQKETVAHHLQRAAQLCSAFCSAWGDEIAGQWMGLFHDFGKYGTLFQDVLTHRAEHVDHALPGAALLWARLKHDPRYLPMAAAVRCHHSRLCLWPEAEFKAWRAGRQAENAEGARYSIPSALDPACKTAVAVFLQENGSRIPARAPKAPTFAGEAYKAHLARMLYTRFLFSALIDADYSASAEHFDPCYLSKASTEPLNADAAWEALQARCAELRRESTADPAINALRSALFDVCAEAGSRAAPGLYTLSAPTGAGKTLAMLAFALRQLLQPQGAKRRVIVVLPYLSIIEQSAAVYRALIPTILEDHSQVEYDAADPAGRELSQRWAAPFIITTSVQFFETLFADSGPSCRKLHQIADSVILFDEAQSLPTNLSRAALGAMHELADRYGCTVLFSTATQPAFDLLPHADWQPQEIVPHPQAIFSAARRVDVRWEFDRLLSLERIAARAAEASNACVIVNLRRHARRLFELLSALRGEDAVFLLSTDLCPAHRTDILAAVKVRLRERKPCYLVSTQCIEAGVDISFDTMFRALAPLESMIQAAGRCNRSGTRRRGTLVVFVPDEPGRLYPDDFYEHAANAVRVLAKRHPIDIDDLSHIREYYALLYSGGWEEEKPELTHAIEHGDFREVCRQYRLIEQRGVTVIVPYAGQTSLYNALRADARGGVTPDWLRRAAPLSVTCYDKRLVEDNCEPLYLPARGAMPLQPAGYYLLGTPCQYDSGKTGLHLGGFDGVF